MKYTTVEASREIGISRQSVHWWIRTGKLHAPALVRNGSWRVRWWTARDIERARAILAPAISRSLRYRKVTKLTTPVHTSSGNSLRAL